MLLGIWETVNHSQLAGFSTGNQSVAVADMNVEAFTMSHGNHSGFVK
ncbi:Uncharacterised protein [Vibrio cholerae]|nr:Uncharacterised protein [Vibrio cholerae]